MNSAEKKVLHIALVLFAVGVLVRVLPWGVPAIEERDEPSKVEYTFVTNKVTEAVVDENLSVVDESVPAVNPPKAQKRKKSAKKSKIIPLPIKINSAGIDELCALKGVGPKLAEKILAFREQNGPFLTPQDLQKVPGIGKKKLEGLLQGIIFD